MYNASNVDRNGINLVLASCITYLVKFHLYGKLNVLGSMSFVIYRALRGSSSNVFPRQSIWVVKFSC